MKLYKNKLQKTLDDVVCDVCGKHCTNPIGIESATIEAVWGYGSHHDGYQFDIDLCEDCFFTIIDHLKQRRKLYPNTDANLYANHDPLIGKQYLK